MRLRALGQTGLNVSPLMLSGNVFGRTASENTSFSILDAFVAGGGNFINSANVYSVCELGHTGGESESVLGISAPIASATTVAQVQELIGAVNLRLDSSAIEQLNEASAA